MKDICSYRLFIRSTIATQSHLPFPPSSALFLRATLSARRGLQDAVEKAADALEASGSSTHGWRIPMGRTGNLFTYILP